MHAASDEDRAWASGAPTIARTRTSSLCIGLVVLVLAVAGMVLPAAWWLTDAAGGHGTNGCLGLLAVCMAPNLPWTLASVRDLYRELRRRRTLARA